MSMTTPLPVRVCAARRGLCCLVAGLLAATAVVGPARSDERPAQSPAAEAKPEWRAGFDAQYRLAEGENAKLIRPPFTADRDAFHRARAHKSLFETPGQYGFRWKDGKVEMRSWSSAPGTVTSALEAAGIEAVDLEGTRDLFDLPVHGDWIVRHGADRAAVLADVQRALAEATDGRVRVEPGSMEKE